jgi:hypothetical protein
VSDILKGNRPETAGVVSFNVGMGGKTKGSSRLQDGRFRCKLEALAHGP